MSLRVPQVIEVEAQFNLSVRRKTSRRYLHIDYKWNLGVEQVMGSVPSEERRETKMNSPLRSIVQYLVTN